MAWTKTPQSLVDLFDESLPGDPRVERRKMFGFPSAFTQGNMFAGVFQDAVFARIAPDERAALEAVRGPLPFQPMPGRSMGAYMLAPEDVQADDAALADFLAAAFRYTVSLPAKEKKPRKKVAAKR